MPIGEPDLYRALRAKDIRRVRECLRDWGNENKRVWWGGGPRPALTPLHVASKGSSQDILRLLLTHPDISSSINTFTDKTNVTPLHEAAGSSSPEVIRLLLDAGADISSLSGDLSSAFHIACSRGRLETCAELLRRGSLLEGRDGEGMTPLLRAAANGRADVTEWLLSEGADPAAVDRNSNTALALSCSCSTAGGCLDGAKALVDGGADVLVQNSDGASCVSLAALSGRTELLDLLLTAMAGSGQRFRDGGGDVLYEAVDRGLGKVVRILTSVRGRELGININRPNPEKQDTTPLHAACFRGQQAIVAQLLSRGAQPDVPDENGLRALHVACACPDSEQMVRFLLKAKADGNILDDFGCSPLYYAFVQGNDDIVRFMLSNGASLFRMDYDQALRIACFYGMIIEVESLLWMEADPASVLFNHRDRGTAFHPSVNPAVRDGVNELLAESSEEEAVAAAAATPFEDETDSRRRSTVGGGPAAAAALKAAREAAAAWEVAEAAGANANGSSAASTATSGWTSGGGESSSCRDGGGSGGYQSSSAASEEGSSGNGGARGGGGGRVRPSFGLGREDLPGEEDGEDDDASENSDDAFILPSMLTLENDLIREDGSFYTNNANIGKNKSNFGRSGGSSSVAAAGAAASLASTGAVAAMRRFGQRVRGGVGGPAAGARSPADSSRGGVGEAGGSDGDGGDGEEACSVSPVNGLGRAKDRAKAKLAGVIKWAQSPRRVLSPRGGRNRAWTEGFAG